jgi:hypothetical protein
MIQMKYFKYIGLLSISMVLWQCEPAIDEFVPSAGNADYTTYVAIGDSYSAGYTDGALGKRGQEVSFPNIIAQQLKLVGMEGDFKQPLTPEGKSVGTTVIDANGNLNGYYYLSIATGSLAPMPSIGNTELLTNPANWINSQAPFNNVAVPGARSYHLIAPQFGNPTLGVGNFNPFYSRFASNPGVSTVMGDAALLQPTFFTLMIGGNDVLGYALAGGETDAVTDINTFNYSVNLVIAKMKETADFGAIANVLDINSLPYFSTIPYNAMVLTADQAAAMNAGYANYNTGAAAMGYPKMKFVAGPNAFIIVDDAMAALGSLRQIKPNEKILLPALSKIQNTEIGWGSKVPIPNAYTLDTAEVKIIKDQTVLYNESILSFAITNSLAFVDVSGLMTELKDGVMIDGNKYSTTFVSGGVFSLDGIHATGRGSAMIANRFINAINTKYNAAIPLVNINAYETVTFPDIYYEL